MAFASFLVFVFLDSQYNNMTIMGQIANYWVIVIL